MQTDSLVSSLLLLPEVEQRAIAHQLSTPARMALWDELKTWSRWARPKQLPPDGEWFYWLIQAGRGWGKTRTAAEYIRGRIDRGEWRTVNVAGPTWMDVMDTQVNGSPSAPGLLDIWPPHKRPVLKLSSANPHLLCWNGAVIRLRAAKEAERFRGTQAEGAWIDEIDSWAPNRMKPAEALALFEFGIRLGSDPRIVATSTPKRGRLVAKLLKRGDCVVSQGAMQENAANLSAKFIRAVETEYGGTRLGRQEIEGILLEDVEGALITLDMIADNRLEAKLRPKLGDYDSICVGVDPSGTETGDAKGIIACGKIGKVGYVITDKSTHAGPDGWGRAVVQLYYTLQADRVVAEVNYGGDMVQHVIHAAADKMGVPRPRFVKVTASRGKHVRAQPIAALHEQGRVKYCGNFPHLEDDMTGFTDSGWEGSGSPDRGDACVWSLTNLLVRNTGLSPSDLYGDDDEEEEAA